MKLRLILNPNIYATLNPRIPICNKGFTFNPQINDNDLFSQKQV